MYLLERANTRPFTTHQIWLSFHKHCNYVTDRIDKRNNVLKALAGSSWGQEKETLLLTYNALGKSIASYAAPMHLTLKVNDHSDMLSAQYLVNCLEEDHVCHGITTQKPRPSPRPMKETLHSRHHSTVLPRLGTSRKESLRNMYTHAVDYVVVVRLSVHVHFTLGLLPRDS